MVGHNLDIGGPFEPDMDFKSTRELPLTLPTWSDPADHTSSFVEANGVRLNYLDWGGPNPALIFLHGAGGNPHYFDDLAPAFAERFRVIAYARRGHGRSAAKDPYDVGTLTEDFRGLMDALGIERGHLAAHSMGGNEMTHMATTYPDRVGRLVYLDAAYDVSDPAFAAALQSLPPHLREGTPPSALTSLDAYRASVSAQLPSVLDTSRFEAWMREDVEIQADGSVHLRVSEGTPRSFAAALNERREYTRVRAPALAIYSSSFGDVRSGAPIRVAENLEWNRQYIAPFRATSIQRVRAELRGVTILELPGTHDDLVFSCREEVVTAMNSFLDASDRKT
jgi:pimeloyl-ACP methyl ester carboxylesterase